MNRHFILTNGRSGSNYFVQLLNQHSAVVNYGEVLGDWTVPGRLVRTRFRDDNAAYLDWLFSSPAAFYGGQILSFAARHRAGKATHFRRRARVASLGVKEFAVNLGRFGLDRFLAARPEIRLVTLVRADPLARLISVRQLAATGEVARVEGKPVAERPRIFLDPASLGSDLEVIEQENESVRQAADRHQGPVLRLDYESFFAAAPQIQTERVAELQAFLGVAPERLQSEHRKLRETRLSEAIENYEDVRKTLAGGPFERWLDAAARA